MVNWSKDLELGIEILDNQHKAIFEQINKLTESYELGEEKEQTYEALQFIEEYVQKHFTTEEFFLAKYEYPDLDNHLLKHKDFSKKLIDFKLSHQRSGIDTRTFQDMMKFLLDWWYNHILDVDREYLPFILKKMNEDNTK